MQRPAEERQSPELYAANVRKLMGEGLGAELSTHGIPQQQALKHNGIYVDWTGRYAAARSCSLSQRSTAAALPCSLSQNGTGTGHKHKSCCCCKPVNMPDLHAM